MTARRVTSKALLAAELAVIETLQAMGAPLPSVAPPAKGPRTSTLAANPVDAFHAAHLVANAVRQLVVEAAAAARGAGSSWLDLANTLDLQAGLGGADLNHTDDDEHRADAAFLYLTVERAPGEQDLDRPLSLAWKCSTCTLTVTDYGPWGDNDEGPEVGHADDCARHQAEVDAADLDDTEGDQP